MAVAGGSDSFTRRPVSLNKSSDEIFDFECAPCGRDGNAMEAVNYCEECSEFFCEACTKHHTKFGSTSKHTVVSREEKADQASDGKKTVDQLPTEKCKEHAGETITTYCTDHDVVVCNTCVSVNHRSCGKVSYIPKISGVTTARLEVPQVQNKVSSALSAIERTQGDKQKHKTLVNDTKTKHLKDINEQTERLIKKARDMEKAAIYDVNRRHKEATDAIDAELAPLDKTKAVLEDRIKGLENAEENSDSTVFVDTKLGMREAKAAKDLVKSITANDSGKVRSMFVVDNRVVSVLNDVNSLGRVMINKPYKATLKGNFSVVAKGDKAVSHINDACELPDGTILAVDTGNVCIKVLNKSFKVTKIFKTPPRPWGICPTGRDEVALTLTQARKVQFVDIRGSNWKLTTSFPVEGGCRGIAHNKGQLFVSCGGHRGNSHYYQDGPGFVAVYTTSGTLLRKFQLDKDDHQIFCLPRHIAITNNGDKIHVADQKGGVVTIDRLGNKLSVVSEKDEHAGVGVCALDDANLFVCGKWTYDVLQINADGERVGDLLERDDKTPRRPWMAFYWRNNATLVVSSTKSNDIEVFELHS